MRAVVQDRYGSSEVLQLRDIAKPEIDDDRVLVRAHAASVNAADWHLMRGEPIPARLGSGLRRPKATVLGIDVAGTVEAVGRNVRAFAPGEEVFGNPGSAFAEFVLGKPHGFVTKPANITFEQAAAVPVAGLTALQGLRDKGMLRAGQSVLINGASGGVGTFAVQLGKVLGADVTGVCSTRNVELVRSLGADHVIDYTHEDFTRSGKRFDLVFDIAGSRPVRTTRRVLAPGGRLVVVGGPGGRWIKPLDRVFAALILSRLGPGRMVPFLSRHNHDDLVTLRDLLAAGTLVPAIDRTYPLEQAAEAVRYVDDGHARAKVVITL